jgi:hypothetical protein
MAVGDHDCQLYVRKTGWSGTESWKPLGKPVRFRLDPNSVPALIDALLDLMGRRSIRADNVEQYRLSVLDASGSAVRSVNPSLEELRVHQDGYTVSAAGAGPGAGDGSLPLIAASNEQLLAELRRRLGGY